MEIITLDSLPLSPLSALLPFSSKGEDTEQPGVQEIGAGGGVSVVQFSLLHITLFNFTSVPKPVGYICLSSVFISVCAPITGCQFVCLSHQRDLHLLRLVALLLLSAGVLLGWRRSGSHRS